jgi:hypothetical protein
MGISEMMNETAVEWMFACAYDAKLTSFPLFQWGALRHSSRKSSEESPRYPTVAISSKTLIIVKAKCTQQLLFVQIYFISSSKSKNTENRK